MSDWSSDVCSSDRYRDSECGCCEAWADIARAEGYAVTVENRADMAAVKTRYGVPDQLASCHTAVIGGYAIEGPVPMQHVARLRSEERRVGKEGVRQCISRWSA